MAGNTCFPAGTERRGIAVEHDSESTSEPNDVSEELACPMCGERGADQLVWRDDEVSVHCATCGQVYEV